MDALKKIGAFAGLCASVLGVLGGIGYACYNHAYLIAVCVAFVGYMAYPRMKEFVNILLNG